MNELMGQPAPVLFSRLGYPDAETVVAGRKAYIWGNRRMGAMPIYTPTTTTGFVGTQPVTMTTSTMNMVPVEYACQIRAIVDAEDRITTWDYRGNQGGCAPYARRLRQ
ncbi:hypothetical protein ACFQU2_23080 [Siccirubricoccus deserti]